jgi:hypothetical protein
LFAPRVIPNELSFWRDFIWSIEAIIPYGAASIERTTTCFNPAARRRFTFVGLLYKLVNLVKEVDSAAYTTIESSF